MSVVFKNITYHVKGVNHFSGDPYAFVLVVSSFVVV